MLDRSCLQGSKVVCNSFILLEYKFREGCLKRNENGDYLLFFHVVTSLQGKYYDLGR